MPFTNRPTLDLPFAEPLRTRFEALRAQLNRRGAVDDGPESERPGVDVDVLAIQQEQVLVLEEELRQSLDALDESRRLTQREATRFRSVFDLAPDPLFVTDARGVLSDGNAAAAELVGFPPSGWAGASLVDFLHPADLATFEDALAAVAHGPTRVRLRFRGKNGRSMRGSVRGAMTAHLGQVLWTVRLERGGSAHAPPPPTSAEIERRLEGRIQELEGEIAAMERRIAAEQRVREDAQATATMNQRVMALVAHEATVVAEHARAWAEPLAEAAEGDVGEGLRGLAWAAQMELEIAKDLLDLARIATHRLRSTFVPVDLAAVARRAATLAAPRAQALGIELRSAIGELGTVAGEPLRLAQMLVGLLGVATAAADRGGAVTIASRVTDERPVIDVSWTGRRLTAFESEWTLEQLGDDVGAVLGPHRLGMSLFVARQLAGLHDARVTVEAEGGSSVATVRVTFARPRRRAGEPPPSNR